MGFSPAGGSISGADDVAISNAADNQVLTYDSSTQLWRNEAVASGGGDPTMGGDLSGTASNAQLVAGVVADAEVSASAAIAQSKIANLTTDLASKAATTHSHAGADITSGTVAAARLGSGTPTNSNYLRGDGTWATPTATAGSIGTEVYFSTLTGADDDAKLASFMAAQSALTMKGKTLVLDEARDYTFTQQQTLYNGFSIRGAFRPQDQPRSSLPIGNRVRLRMTGGIKGWFILPSSGSIFGVSMTNMSIDGDINSLLVEGTSAVLWTSVFRDISVQNARGVFGRPSRTLLVTACTIDGWWNVNNVQERAFCFGGSDFYFQPSMFLLDSPDTLLGPTEYLGGLEFQSNTWMQNIYCTAEGHSAFLLAGGASANSVWIKDCVIEGRNAGAPSPGALVRMTGGQFTMRDNRFAFAMTNPSATGRNDSGVIHVAGGTLTVDGATYDRATGVAETVPFIYVSGTNTRVRVRNVTKLGTWTGKPVVKQAIAGLIDADDTVTLVTAAVAQAQSGVNDVTTGSANTGTSVTVNKPSNTVDGDVLVAAVWSRNATAVYTTPPSGWTIVAPTTDDTSTGVIRIYHKVINNAAGEPASYTWAGGGSGRQTGIISRVTGVNLASVGNAQGAVATLIGSPDRVIAPAVTTTADNTLLLAAVGGNNTGGIVPTFTNGQMTVIGNAATNTGASESGLTLLAEVVPATGSTGTRSLPASPSAASGLGYMVAINSAG